MLYILLIKHLIYKTTRVHNTTHTVRVPTTVRYSIENELTSLECIDRFQQLIVLLKIVKQQ